MGGRGGEIWGARWAGLQDWGGLYAIVLVMEKGSVAWVSKWRRDKWHVFCDSERVGLGPLERCLHDSMEI